MSGHDFGTAGSGANKTGDAGGTAPATAFHTNGFAPAGVLVGGFQALQQHAPPASGIPPQQASGGATSIGATSAGTSTPMPQGSAVPAPGAPGAAPAAWGSAAAGTSAVPFAPGFGHQQQQLLGQLYPGLRKLSETPPLFLVDDFFTGPECDALMVLASDYMIASPVVGAGAGEVSASRTSSSCFLAREDLPTVCSRVMALTGKPFEHLELPQVGRYFTSQKYANHWDAFDLATEDGRRFAQNGGQRVCTVLVYLNDVASGGCTAFPQLGMKVQPKKGMAVVFFPATLDGTLDSRLLHAAEPAVDTKWVSQIWIRQGAYHGTPTARIPRI